MQAGRDWARPRPRRSDPAAVDEDAAFFGLTVEPAAPPTETEIWEGHADALDAFLRISSQWRTAGGGMGEVIWIGLDYSAAQAALDLTGITVTPETWTQVQMIEAGAREALNNRDHRR